MVDGFKDFQGKSLDDAISAACSYFDAPRERLEIDIIQDAKTGIFGIVGSRKAKIRARRVQWRNAMESILGQRAAREDTEEAVLAASTPDRKGDEQDSPPAGATAQRRERSKGDEERLSEEGERRVSRDRRRRTFRPRREDSGEGRAASRRNARSQREHVPSGEGKGDISSSGVEEERLSRRGHSRTGQERSLRSAQYREVLSVPVVDQETGHEESFSEGFQEVPFEELDQERLKTLAADVVARLVAPLAGAVPVTVSLGDNRVNVSLECGEDSGLLIGREGQTLASLQYLTSRIVSQGMGAAVRVHLDAGEYRLRQDEKLRELALALAEKVRATGKSCSTRPLSSYHRRIIHMTLQDTEDIQTRSSGDGPLKRVVVLRRRH